MDKVEVKDMMAVLLESAKKVRESFKYSGDEKMMPMAFIYGEKVEMMMMAWSDNQEKYRMAAAANAEARRLKAKSLSIATDSRWVKSDVFAEYYKLPAPTRSNLDGFTREYHRILKDKGGQIKNLPRQLWQEAVVVFTNGPGIPITIQMAPYEEGDYDTIRWLPRESKDNESGRSDLLTDWWS